MAEPYYCIQDAETELFLRSINEFRSDSEQRIYVPNGVLYMTKRSGLRFKSLAALDRYLAIEFGMRHPPNNFFDGDNAVVKEAIRINPNYHDWVGRSKIPCVSELPGSFRVVLVTPRSEAGPRTVVPLVEYSLARQCDYVLRRKRGLQTHGPSFLLVLEKIEERAATNLTHALVLRPPRKGIHTSDSRNIGSAVRTLALGRKDTIRATAGYATTIAFASENDAIAFRLCYSGGYAMKLVELEEFTRSCASGSEGS